MAISYNKVTLVGRVGSEPERKGRDEGFVTFRMATSESWKGRDGERAERVQWHSIVVYNKPTADFAEKYVHKGDMVLVEGAVEYREHESKYYTDIVIRPFSGQLQLQSKDRGGDSGADRSDHGRGAGDSGPGQGPGRRSTPAFESGGFDDDIPF